MMADNDELKLPPLLNYPSKAIQDQLPSEEWNVCLAIWVSSIELRLRLTEKQFTDLSVDALGVPFLLSYLSRSSSRTISTSVDGQDKPFHRICKVYLQKVITSQVNRLIPLLLFDLLGSGSLAYARSETWKNTVKKSWQQQQKQVKKAIESVKSTLSASSSAPAQAQCLRKLSALTKALPATATVTVAGADYLDTLTDLYQYGTAELREAITENLFCSFVALLQERHVSILTDNVYHLKSESDRLRKSNANATTVLSSLLCTTTFLKHMSANSDIATRKQTLIEQLTQYKRDTLHLHPLPQKAKQRKGKTRAVEDNAVHMHKAAQVSQIHELFPHLSTSYVLKVLDFYENDAEASVAALLEPDSLPAHLHDQNIPDDQPYVEAAVRDLEPRSTPDFAPERRGRIEDEFDRLEISSKQIRRGKKAVTDEPITSQGHAKSKAAILSALAAFDSDDDERDDTYDIADIGGAVDNTVDSDERRQAAIDPHEASLYGSWKANRELFARDSKTRASNIRQQLKRETGLSDEQIEGWAIMLDKDKKMQDRLADRYSSATSFSGQQRVIESTKWQANTSADNSETESGAERSNDNRRMGQAGIRGHRNFGRGGGRGGGTASGAPGDAATQQARKRKEQGRGRGGANNRRDARAKKVGRGMGPINPA